MIQTNTISIGAILWKVLNNPLASNLTFDEAAEFATEAIRLVGAPVLFEDKPAEIKIVEHKGLIPTDIIYIKGVREPETGRTFREATDIYHQSDYQSELTELTYEIKKNIIFTSIRTGCIEMSYKALQTDEQGYPMVADHAKLKLALEYYILHRYLEPMYMMGKITDKAFHYVEQKRHFYMGSASNDLKMPSMDKMESIMNGVNRLLVNQNPHANGFKNYGKQEQFKKY